MGDSAKARRWLREGRAARREERRQEREVRRWEALTDSGRYPAEQSLLWWHNDPSWHRFVDRIAVEAEGGTIEQSGEASVHELRQRLTEHRDSHWVWLGAHSSGRGTVRIYRQQQPVPRVLWTWLRGGSPDTRRVLKRRCDREGCCNPWHHELMRRGTWQEGWNGDPANRAPSGWAQYTTE